MMDGPDHMHHVIPLHSIHPLDGLHTFMNKLQPPALRPMRLTSTREGGKGTNDCSHVTTVNVDDVEETSSLKEQIVFGSTNCYEVCMYMCVNVCMCVVRMAAHM